MNSYLHGISAYTNEFLLSYPTLLLIRWLCATSVHLYLVILSCSTRWSCYCGSPASASWWARQAARSFGHGHSSLVAIYIGGIGEFLMSSTGRRDLRGESISASD